MPSERGGGGNAQLLGKCGNLGKDIKECIMGDC